MTLDVLGSVNRFTRTELLMKKKLKSFERKTGETGDDPDFQLLSALILIMIRFIFILCETEIFYNN